MLGLLKSHWINNKILTIPRDLCTGSVSGILLIIVPVVVVVLRPAMIKVRVPLGTPPVLAVVLITGRGGG